MVKEAYGPTRWTQHHTPEAWKLNWLVPLPIPNGYSNKVTDKRSSILMKILRKLWTGLIKL